MRSHRLLTVSFALVSLVAAACGASPRVEREVAARSGSPLSAGRAVGTDSGAAASSATGLDGATAAGSGAGGAAVSGPASSTAGATSGTARATTGQSSAAAPAPSGGNGGDTDIGVTATSIKIGGTYFNGNYLDKYSQVTEQAAGAYFRYINDHGGIYGRKIEYRTCDTSGTADGTQGCLKKLGDQDKVFIMGPSLDFNLNTVQPYLAQHKLPWVGSSGLYPEEFTSPWMFPTQLRGFDVGALIATFSSQKLAVKTVAVSFLNDVAGPACTQRVHDVGAKLGFRVVADVGNAQVESDLTPQVLRTRQANPDAVLFCNDPINTIKFVQAAGRTGYKPPKGFVGGFVAADDVPQAMGSAGVGVYGFTGYDFYKDNTAGVKRYRDISTYYYPSTFFHFYSQAAFTGAVAIVEALKGAGPKLTRITFLAALRAMHDFDSGMGLRIDFANLGHNSSGLMLQADSNLKWHQISDRFSPAA
jgi:branched-chain amino acid transport system substrate-binding protein